MTWNTCLGGNDIIMFIMRLYKAKKIRKTIPNSFQMHKLLFSASSPSLAGFGVSHRQFFSGAELPPTISGDSGRALAGLGCHVEKHPVSESKSLWGRGGVSKCHHLLMGTRLQTKHPRKKKQEQTGLMSHYESPGCCLNGTTYWSATRWQQALKILAPTPFPPTPEIL